MKLIDHLRTLTFLALVFSALLLPTRITSYPFTYSNLCVLSQYYPRSLSAESHSDVTSCNIA
jgi:hypothetical protein